MTRQYFSFISYHYVPKNKLDKAIMALMESYNRMVIPKENIQLFKEQVLLSIHALELEHSKCRPKKAAWYDDSGSYAYDHGKGDLILQGIEVCKFHLYGSK